MERYVATGSQTTSCLMSQYNDGPRNSTKSKWMLPGGSPTREMIPVNERTTSNITGRQKLWGEYPGFADSFFGNFHLFTVGNFELWFSPFFLERSRSFYFSHSFVPRSLVDRTVFLLISFLQDKKKEKRRNERNFRSLSSFLVLIHCAWLSEEEEAVSIVKNHDDTIYSSVNTLAELIIIHKPAPVAIAQLTSASHACLAAGGGEKSGFHVDSIVFSAVDRP